MTIKADAAAKLLQFFNSEDWEIDYSAPATGLIIRHQSGTEITFKPDGTVDAPSVSAGSIETDTQSINEQAAKIFASADTTVSSGTVTTLSFDSQDPAFNPGSVLSVDTANNKITAEKSGRYLCVASATLRSPPNGTRVRTGVNAAAPLEKANNDNTAGSSRRTGATATGIITVSSSKNITAEIFHDAGSNQTIVGSEFDRYLHVARLG